MPFLESLQLDAFLSFRRGSAPIPLTALNVLIGPNASGKSNLIEAVELLLATPGDLASAVRLGGSPREWIWKGEDAHETEIKATLNIPEHPRPLRYRLAFIEASQARLEIADEAIEELAAEPGKDRPYFYYAFQRGHPAINMLPPRMGGRSERRLKREDLDPQQSVLSQRRDPESYPEVAAIGRRFAAIQTVREWSLGRLAAPRLVQKADGRSAPLEADGSNLGLFLSDLAHTDSWHRFKECMRRFLPRFHDVTVKIQADGVQIHLHEEGLRSPVPATRLSDGTIRFMALLAILLRAETSPLICIEEPELGLHPEALSLIAELLVEASERSQLIVTTHSDAPVSALTNHAESVLVCEHLAGATELTRVDSEKLKFWLEKYRLGEIWRIGQLGGNP